MNLVTDIAFPVLAEGLSHNFSILNDGKTATNRVLLDQMESDLILALCHVRTLKNAKQAVNCLPSEIMAQIFVHFDALQAVRTMQDIRVASTKKIKTMSILTQVCRQWRVIMFSTPSLWNHIHIRSSSTDPIAMRSLLLSGNLPLVTYYFCWQDRPGTIAGAPMGDPTFQMMAQNVYTLQKLYLYVDWTSDSAYWMELQQHAPIIQVVQILGVNRRSRNSTSLPGDLFKGQFWPSLERLSLSYYTFSPTLAHFSNLKSLRLYNQTSEAEDALGFSRYLPAIAASPQLEELILSRPEPIIQRTPSSEPIYIDNPISLPHLQVLSLGCWHYDSDDVLDFMGCIRFPETTSIYIFGISYNEWNLRIDNLIETARRSSSSHRPIRSLRMAASRVIDGSYGFALEGDTLTFTSNMEGELRESLWKSGILSQVEHFTLVSSVSYPLMAAEFAEIFSALPALRHLVVSGATTESVLLTRIANALGLSLSATLPSCPLLESLEALYFPDMDELPQAEDDERSQVDATAISMLAKERAQSGRPLKKVVLERCGKGRIELLKRSVQDVSVVKRWNNCPGGYFELAILKQMHELTVNPLAVS
ncbi:hypothetical protein D9611_008283 [Ephemerocybe angulata]|uniref:F-box domain-containing protein n=1 Tax=Ephemerocybe angulata TaxID=980116 RepID=A0A8H5F529_9AGAR|nr:hypothetical protein D9611_008283 [Tulosesus angulatus]